MATTTNEARLRLTAQDETGRGMASAANNMRRTADEADRQSRRISQAMQRQQAAMARGVAAGAIVAGAGVAAAAQVGAKLKDSYNEFARADRYLTRIGNNAGKSAREMAGVGRSLSTIANDLALPLDTVAEGLDSLVASGRNLEDSLAFLPEVAKAAQASGAEITDIATSANALATSMGFTGQQMGKVFDVLVAGGQAGNFELKDMARYLPALAPLAASVGYKGEEGLKKLVAILQVVRKGTGDAGQAADATREVFSKMNSEELQNNFRALGNYDLKGVMEEAAKAGKDLPSTFLGFTRDVLNQTANGADPLLKLPMLFKDVQLQNGVRALLGAPGAVRDLVAQLNNVDGTVVKNLANVTNDAAANAQKLSNSWKGVERAIGEAMVAARAPEGLDWLTQRLDRAAEGLRNISRLGFWTAAGRAVDREVVARHQEERTAKIAEMEGKSGPARARLEAELREIEERLALAKGRFDRKDQSDTQAAEGLPPLPDLPGPLDPELTPGQGRSGDPNGWGPTPSFKAPRDPNGFGPDGLFSPTSFGEEAAQEDTQRQMAQDIRAIRGLWTRVIGPNAPSGRLGMGQMIHKASARIDDADGAVGGDQNGGTGTGGGGGGAVGGYGGGGSGGGSSGPGRGRGGQGPGRGSGGSGGSGGGSGGPGRGGSTPADDGGAAEVAGAMNPRLAGSRKALMDELDRDPALKRDVIKTASMENRGSPAKMQAVIESMVNRSKMNGYRSLRQAITSGFYGPVNRGGLRGALSEKDARDGEVALKRVAGGSNMIGYRTDQGMLTDPGARRYMREPDKSGHAVIGGENFFYMGQKGRAWARQQQGLDAANPAASAAPAATAAKPREAPPIGSDGFGARARGEERLTPNQQERIRERPSTQARRETDREVRHARMLTYSDVGVAGALLAVVLSGLVSSLWSAPWSMFT